MLAVFGGDQPFTYTIGNAEKGLPELLMVGIGSKTSHDVLNDLSEKMVERGRAFDDLERVDVGGKVPVCVIEADDVVKEKFTIQVGGALGIDDRDYRVLQVLCPDEEGRLPWQSDCAEPYRSLPVYKRGGVQ